MVETVKAIAQTELKKKLLYSLGQLYLIPLEVHLMGFSN
jgi:hypothetical protein|tara:strand:+ start:3112 stop:3228 length:117 start_codon:yes stop_codon:yes gene_type:complete